MKNADAIKAILLAAINEIAADPKKYAANPGRDFTRNRKLIIITFSRTSYFNNTFICKNIFFFKMTQAIIFFSICIFNMGTRS